MKTDEKATLLQTDKAELKKLVAEVKAIVASIIHLPLEKKVSFAKSAL